MYLIRYSAIAHGDFAMYFKFARVRDSILKFPSRFEDLDDQLDLPRIAHRHLKRLAVTFPFPRYQFG